jgi:hypothetical protein
MEARQPSVAAHFPRACHMVLAVGNTDILSTNGRKGFTMTCDLSTEYCNCPSEIELLQFIHPKTYSQPHFETHSPHGPFAYVYAHAQDSSSTAFSFAQAG